jgi:acyl-CoA thioester hydrolase
MRFPFRWTLSATLRDTDGVGHVNNAVYLSWIEEARVRYVVSRRGPRPIEELDFILARAELDYRSPVKMLEEVEIWCGPSRLGNSSWELRYEALARLDGRLVLEARSVQVQFDYAAQRPKPLVDPWRGQLEKDLLR